MDAVARNSSEDVLRTIDRLLVEGQSAQHFARQMVRFLRNALVAKVAGSDSPVLQISSDERARVARVAERFSEEDLTRFLQIMLRTHSDLGYKQEQRFHLELGLLKLVHAQRLLPLEAVAERGGGIRDARSPRGRLAARLHRPRVHVAQRVSPPQRSSPPERRQSRTSAASPFNGPSPFEADRSRKSEPKAEAPDSYCAPRLAARVELRIVRRCRLREGRSAISRRCRGRRRGAAACLPKMLTRRYGLAPQCGPWRAGRCRTADVGAQPGRRRVVGARQRSAVKVAMSQVMMRYRVGRRSASASSAAALAKASGRPMKFKMVSGGAQFAPSQRRPTPRPATVPARAAAQCPIQSCSACRRSSAPRFVP